MARILKIGFKQNLVSTGDASQHKMDTNTTKNNQNRSSRPKWRLETSFQITLYILLFLTQKCQANNESLTKISLENVDSNVTLDPNVPIDNTKCHSCESARKMYDNKDAQNNNNLNNNYLNDDNENESQVKHPSRFVERVISTVGSIVKEYLLVNKTVVEGDLQNELERLIDKVLNKDKYVLFDGIEINTVKSENNDTNERKDLQEGRSFFPKYSYEHRMLEKIKTFVDTHIVSINLPKAARLFGFRSFGLKKFFLPLLIGMQIFKSVLLAMFLPSILGSFGKILGKGISQVSAASSQASYPPAQVDEHGGFTQDNMGFDTNQYNFPQENMFMTDAQGNDVDDLANVDMSRYGPGGEKVSFLPAKNGYYANQVAESNNYKVFHKIPASSMILNNYDPFYSPLLSRLDGIFARLGLAPEPNSADTGQQIGGQSLSSVKLEACREQLVCVMYASPAKYAPYSNLISAQLSRELNELRRPVSDNPEILRFFRYMRAARRGQEGVDCMRLFPSCSTLATPSHTMFAAYHDINKLVTARKLQAK